MLRKFICVVLLFTTSTAWAISLRTLVALPIPKGDTVFRLLNTHNTDTDANNLSASAAYGINKAGTVFLGMPYRIYPKGNARTGDISVLYRHMLIQEDRIDGTFRLGALLGGFIPTTGNSDGGLREGLVATYYRDRTEIDVDVIIKQGIKQSLNEFNYDISWQYRIAPAEYPEWACLLFGILF